MEPLDIQDKIDAFVKKRLPPEDRAAFEEDVARDPALAEAVKQAQLEYDAANLLVENNILGWFDEWDKKESAEKPPDIQAVAAAPLLTVASSKARRFSTWWAIAATMMLLLGALYFFYPSDEATTPVAQTDKPITPSPGNGTTPPPLLPPPALTVEQAEKVLAPPAADPRYTALARENFEVDGSDINLMGTSDAQSPQDPLHLAAEALEQKDYARAVEWLKQVPSGNPDDFLAAQIGLGDVYFQQGRYNLAEKAYVAPARSDKDKFRDVAEWHLLLTYLARYPQRKAVFGQLMNKILKDADHSYHAKAEALKQALEGK